MAKGPRRKQAGPTAARVARPPARTKPKTPSPADIEATPQSMQASPPPRGEIRRVPTHSDAGPVSPREALIYMQASLRRNTAMLSLVLRWLTFFTMRLLLVTLAVIAFWSLSRLLRHFVEWATLTALLSGLLTTVLVVYKVAASQVPRDGRASPDWPTARSAMNEGLLREMETAGRIVGITSVVALLGGLSLATVNAIVGDRQRGLSVDAIVADYLNPAFVLGPLVGIVIWAAHVARTEASHYLPAGSPMSSMNPGSWPRRLVDGFMLVALLVTSGLGSAAFVAATR